MLEEFRKHVEAILSLTGLDRLDDTRSGVLHRVRGEVTDVAQRVEIISKVRRHILRYCIDLRNEVSITRLVPALRVPQSRLQGAAADSSGGLGAYLKNLICLGAHLYKLRRHLRWPRSGSWPFRIESLDGCSMQEGHDWRLDGQGEVALRETHN